MEIFSVSVIVPVYNGAATLNACLLSIFNQTRPADEIIVVDNGSNDGSLALVEALLPIQPSLRLVHEPIRSRGSARNAGVQVARGDLLFFTDQDCVVPSNWIAGLVLNFNDEAVDAVVGAQRDAVGTYWSAQHQRAEAVFVARNYDGDYLQHIDTKNLAIRGDLVRHSNFNPQLGNMEDFEWFLRLRAAGVRILFRPDVIVTHHHKATWLALVRSTFSRGYWVACIRRLHPHAQAIMFESISWYNAFTFVPWLLLRALRDPVSFPYTISAELAWRAGVVISIIRNRTAI